MEIVETKTPVVTAGKILNLKLSELINTPTLFLTSGGSALALLDQLDIKMLTENLTIGVVDDRCSVDPDVNNFTRLTKKGFYESAKVAGVKFIDTRPRNEDCDPATLADYFQRELKKWRTKYPEGKILVTLGMGEDGHTAGIFPEVSVVDFAGADWVVGYQVPKSVNQYQDRITTTYTFLQDMVDEVLVYVTGESKTAQLKTIFARLDFDPNLPISIIHKLKSVTLVTDSLLR